MKGRTLFKSLVDQMNDITNANPTTGYYDTIDYKFQHCNWQYGVEIKVRRAEAEAFSTYVMECAKYNSIVKLIKDKKINGAYYACFFGDDVVYLFNIHSIAEGIKSGKVLIDQMYMPKTTSGDNTKIKKQVLHLNPRMAIRYKRINGKWQKV